jgi:hypothetical protein
MPRKQNGWNNPVDATFKKFGTDPKQKGAAGSYPSFRQYGSTITRTAIEQWDLDSTWARWRKGMEYYYQAAWLPLLTENPNYDYSLPDQRDPTKPNYNPRFVTQQLNTILYQGTIVEIPVTFEGYRFATKNADSKTHYVLKRTIDNNVELGYIAAIYNNRNQYKENYANKELWIEVVAGRNINSDYALVRSEGDRISDGEVSANILKVLTSNERPAMYTGKSREKDCSIQLEVPSLDILATDFVDKNGIDALVGNVVYVRDFYVQQPIDASEVFTDFPRFMQVDSLVKQSNVSVEILDAGATNLPPSLLDISNLEKIYETNAGETTLTATHFFRKEDYQRYFGIQYLTAEVMQSEVDTIAFPIMPFIILGVRINQANGKVVIESEPFQSSIQLFTPPEAQRVVILSDSSFTRQSPDVDSNGNYNHQAPTPGEPLWEKLDIGINPWMDETFIAGSRLFYGDIYSCSCPAYLHAKIRQPEVVDEEGNLINRQARIPLPTSQSQNTYDGTGTFKVSGIIQSWATEKYKRDFKICKHTVAAMFINKIRVMEPNTLPSYETRLKFEENLRADIDEVSQEFGEMLRRSEVTTIELIYALSEALNMDDIELGYLMQNANF